jgi:hypothetical protein
MARRVASEIKERKKGIVSQPLTGRREQALSKLSQMAGIKPVFA